MKVDKSVSMCKYLKLNFTESYTAGITVYYSFNETHCRRIKVFSPSIYEQGFLGKYHNCRKKCNDNS
jgi:hypothetical protein